MAEQAHFPRKVLLGITGGIAAYKAPLLVRALIKAGAEVQVVLTEAALEFVTPLTLSTVSKRPVHRTLVNEDGDGTWTNHVELAEWADVFLVAPLTANTLSKFANGRCNDLLTACYLSANCPVYVAPAMDLEMYKDQSTQKNLNSLIQRGVKTIGPESGELASGLVGKGRMTEPEDILTFLIQDIFGDSKWAGKKILVTAGGTREAIDPVRFIGNRSTGTMGLAIAEELALRGAHVELVLGAVDKTSDRAGIHISKAPSAEEMARKCKELFPTMDVVIKAAAVADYRPRDPKDEKIKKESGAMERIELERTEDILAWMGQNKNNSQVLIGFALESEKGMDHAMSKLERKNADMIVLNSLKNEGAGFGHGTNQVTLLTMDKEAVEIPLMSKVDVARQILDHAERLL